PSNDRPRFERRDGQAPRRDVQDRGDKPRFEKREGGYDRSQRPSNDRPRFERRDGQAPRRDVQDRGDNTKAAPSGIFKSAPQTDEFPVTPSHITHVDSPQAPRAGQRLPNTSIQETERVSVRATQAEQYQIFAPCPQGLEEALATELRALGYEQVQQSRAGCHFVSDWIGVMRANLYSRLATRILVQLSQAKVFNEDDILTLARLTPWERWFGPEDSLRVDTSAVRSPMQSLQYCNLRAKDGICDRLREKEGARPSIDTVRPDARVHLFLNEDSATLYLDTSGESLFKRGWRHNKGEAPLRENLAAGMLMLSDWDPNSTLLDPFCGSGTLLIEAAWIALGAPPGIWRPFHFERLRVHDARLWRDIKAQARAAIAPRLDTPLIGYDLNPEVLEAARANLERAHLTADTIRFEVGDALTIKAPAEQGWIVTNPPYGERMELNNDNFWRDWSANLKQNFSGWNVNVISSDLDLPSQMRLKAKRRYPLYNGALDCRLFNFEMVAAEYRS
ncbi:THUMP domain-containing class I SAM-dependent RNA methyltransferase, partial [Alcaligenes endophyticus]